MLVARSWPRTAGGTSPERCKVVSFPQLSFPFNPGPISSSPSGQGSAKCAWRWVDLMSMCGHAPCTAIGLIVAVWSRPRAPIGRGGPGACPRPVLCKRGGRGGDCLGLLGAVPTAQPQRDAGRRLAVQPRGARGAPGLRGPAGRPGKRNQGSPGAGEGPQRLHSPGRAQTNNPTHRLSQTGCVGSAMETPKHPVPHKAGSGETGSAGHRRCPFRRQGTSTGISQEGGESSLQQLLEAFISAGRVDHVALVMGLHPQYLSSFWKTQYLLLRMDGPLPYHKRHYIAIMAAARHRCSYLVGVHMREFLQVGGSPSWLRGLHCAPQKLRNLNEINKLLAHRPWLITKEHIEALLKPGEDSWSLAELVQALVLLTHYHSLASFVFGCGIKPEEEQDMGNSCWAPSPHSDSSPASDDCTGGSGGTDAMQEVEVLMERMKLLQENQLEEEGVTQEEMVTRFELERTESLLVPSSDILDPSLQSNIRCFLEDPEFGYKDFTRRGEQAPPTFRAQDYTWEDHGYSLINRLYPDVGQLLDEKFQVVYNLTYNTIAMHCGVDTSMLRRAIWNYVHCVFGIRYDDYDYGEVNQLLERNLKIYIKTVACYPEKTTKQIYTQFWRHFKHSEKVHVNLLLLEARMQAALLYALRAVTRYMT